MSSGWLEKASLYVGSLLPEDATGNSIMLKHELLLSRGVDSRILCGRNEARHRGVWQVDGLISALRQVRRFFQTDLHLFEFGFRFDLFPLIAKVRPEAFKVVYFHGLAPRHLVPESVSSALNGSYEQFKLSNLADVVLHATEYSKQLAISLGVTEPAYVKLPLPIDLPLIEKQPSRSSGLRLLQVGRLAETKGLLDSLHALQSLEADWSLQVVFNPMTADASYRCQVEDFIRKHGMTERVNLMGAVSSRQQLAELYSASDITLIPTLHETYCLPLIESLWCGTPVIAYAAGAIPEVAAGHANLVESGNVQALAEMIQRVSATRPQVCCDSLGLVSSENFVRSCRLQLADLNLDTFECRFMKILEQLPELRAERQGRQR